MKNVATGLGATSVVLLGLLAPLVAWAQSPNSVRDTLPVVHAVRTTAAIRIDGRLDESAWAAAPAYDDFTQIDPDEGQPASQRTVARILYDDEALYVGVRLYDTGQVIGRLGRRDMDLGDSDWLGVMLDSYHDHRTAFGFDINPAGVRRDEIKVIETDDNSWDPVWDGVTTVDDSGWTAEYRIPFSQLRFSSAEVQTWGIQLERVIGRRREYSVSTFIPKREQGGVPKYGLLEGLRGIRPGRRLELMPYSVVRGEYTDPGANPYRSNAEQKLSAGLDLKYGLTSNMTVDATINPDFGQVEVDPAVINLGVYETYFEEKRPFFVEGSEIFDFGSGPGGALFYTRRIGRAPQVAPPTPLADVPTATTILGAAKLSGKTPSGWSVGGVEALTQREVARYRDANGNDLEMTAEPLTNYFVGRVRRDLRGGASAIGGMFTAVDRRMSEPAAEAQLRSGAYAGGIDSRHEWANRIWALRGSIAGSYILGSRQAITLVQRLSNHYFQRPDATHLEVDTSATSLAGLTAFLALARQAGEHWRGEMSLATTTPGYEVNDVGFNYRTDRRDFETDVTYYENRPGPFFRSWHIGGRARFEFNMADQLIADWLTLTGYGRHLNYWYIYAQANHSLRANDDRLTRGGPMAVRPASSDAAIQFMSDARKPVTMSAFVSGARDEFGGWSATEQLSVQLRTSSRWNLSLGPSLVRQYTVAQYVTTVRDPAALQTFGSWYVFAPLDYTELSLEARFNVAFTPDLSVEAYVQPLLSSGDYGDPKALTAPSTFDFAPYTGGVPNRDFNVRSLRGNAVLRWEWRRGSTIYLAWQQSRNSYDPLGNFDFGRDRRALFAARPDNIFVIKASYWFNP
jgi:hypothetical protein